MKVFYTCLILFGIAVGSVITSSFYKYSHTNRNEVPEVVETESAKERIARLQAIYNSRAKANRVEVIETRVIEPSNLASPMDLIEKLKTVEADSPYFIQRRTIHYLEGLVDFGEAAFPAIKIFLNESVDKEYLTTSQKEYLKLRQLGINDGILKAVKQAPPRPTLNKVSPISLRLSIFEVLRQSGSKKAESILVEYLHKTLRGVEIAYIDSILSQMAPGKHKDSVLSVARNVLQIQQTIPDPCLLDLMSDDYLLGVLFKYEDSSAINIFKKRLVQPNGRLDPTSVKYLSKMLVENKITVFSDLILEGEIRNQWDKRALRQKILPHVGIDKKADSIFMVALKESLDNNDFNTSLDIGIIFMAITSSPYPNVDARDLPKIVLKSRLELINSAKPYMTTAPRRKKVEYYEKIISNWIVN